MDYGVQNDGQNRIGSVGDLAPDRDDGIFLFRPMRDCRDLGMPCERHAGAHRPLKSGFDAGACDAGDLPPHRLDDQPLIDRRGVQSAGDEAAERALCRGDRIDMDEEGIETFREVDDFGLFDRVGAKRKTLPDRKVFGVKHEGLVPGREERRR